MLIRQCHRTKYGKRHAYWALAESYRSERGSQQHVVAWLGKLDQAGRIVVRRAADERRSSASFARQLTLFDDAAENEAEPGWVEVKASALRVENCRQFGGPWLALKLIHHLQLDASLERVLPRGREGVP